MEGVVKFNQIFISSDRQDVIFVWMKSHFPFSLPYCKFVDILLQMLCIDSGFYSHVCNGVICKLSCGGVETD